MLYIELFQFKLMLHITKYGSTEKTGKKVYQQALRFGHRINNP